MQEQFFIKSEEPALPGQLVLSILSGANYIAYALYDPRCQSLAELRWYGTNGDPHNTLEALFDLNPHLKAGYKRVTIGIDNNTNVLLAAALNSGDHLACLYLSGADTTAIQKQDRIHASDTIILYSIGQEFEQKLNQNFTTYVLKHLKTLWLENLQAKTTDGVLEVTVLNDSFLLVASKEKKVLLAQTFPYGSPADMLFYLLRVCQAHGLSQDTVLLSLSGLVEERSSLYKTLYLYFVRIELRQAGWKMPEHLDFPASHLFTSLFLLSTCE